MASEGSVERPDGAPGRMRILIVDDDPDIAESMAMVLSLEGFEADVAYGGRSALRVAKSHPPHVAILDISMPGMNGFELAKELRRMFPHILLIAVTAHDAEDERWRN